MSGRAEILGRIKEALRLKGHRPKRAGTSGEGARSDSTVHDWLPVVPNDHEGMIATLPGTARSFEHSITGLPVYPNSPRKLLELKNSENWKLIASHRTPILDSILGLFWVASPSGG